MRDVGPEGLTGQWAIQDEGSGQARCPQGTDERRRLPVSMRDAAYAALAPRCATPPSGQVGGKPALIDEHQAGGDPGRL